MEAGSPAGTAGQDGSAKALEKQFSAAAARMRRYRERQRNGRRPLLIDVDEVAVSAFLVAIGYLPAGSTDDQAAIREATEKWIAAATSPEAFERVTASRRAISETGMIRKIA